jgi:ABC-type glycerol-3-phosphate transport system substrate-binding protein
LVSKDSEFKNFESFAKGETSMVFGYARDRDKIIEIARTLRKQGRKAISSDVIRVAYLPQINDPETNPNMRVVGKVYSMVVPITAKYPKLSWNFLKFAVKKDNIKSFGDETGIPVSRVDLLVEQENVPYVGIYARQAKFARPNVLPIIKKQDFKKTFNEILNNVVDKNINISRATNKWGQLVNIELSEYWKREKALERPSNKKKVPAEKKIEDKKK